MDLIYGVCLKYLENNEDARDAVLNIFEELTVKVKKYEIQHFKAWLYQLSKNHCLMILRKRKTIPVNAEIDLMQSGELLHLDYDNQTEHQFNLLQHCMEQLTDHQKNSIRMFYLEGKCYKNIADSTGLDAGKIRSFIQNGRRNLKICMENKSIEKLTH
jgi:RNA polymerase sigma-70 factor (ECF subfamily)